MYTRTIVINRLRARAFSVSRLLYERIARVLYATFVRPRAYLLIYIYIFIRVYIIIVTARIRTHASAGRSPTPRVYKISSDDGQGCCGRTGVICAPNGRGAVDDGGVVSLTTLNERRLHTAAAILLLHETYTFLSHTHFLQCRYSRPISSGFFRRRLLLPLRFLNAFL